jgi:hypothetical protein
MLTQFIIDMLRGDLATNDTAALAAEYRIKREFAEGYLRLWMGE